MNFTGIGLRALTGLALALVSCAALAADYPTPQEGSRVVRDFRFHTGEVLPELQLHYNPSAGLELIQAVVLAINSADDERNPPELGVLDRDIKRVKNGRVFLIPASDQTAGHGTTGQAKFWKKELSEVLRATSRGAE